MPNYCDFNGRVRAANKPELGTERERLQKFLDWLNADYSYYTGDGIPKVTVVRASGKEEQTEHHIGYNIFDTDTKDLSAFEKEDTGLVVNFSGYCAWSVFCCMFEGDFAYYSDNHEENLKKYGYDPSITLSDACKELGLEVEIFSNEPGMCFAEHYLVSADGEVIISEETQFTDVYIDETETYDELREIYAEEGHSCPILETDFNRAKKKGEGFVSVCSWLNSQKQWPFKFA